MTSKAIASIEPTIFGVDMGKPGDDKTVVATGCIFDGSIITITGLIILSSPQTPLEARKNADGTYEVSCG